jgi:hypothetical protein
MARWPGAIWQPVSQFSGTLRPIAVCLHHQAGSGNPAPVYASRNVSAHFWIPKSAQPVQHVDTANRAWHGVAHNDYSIGVETEGCGAPPHAEPLTEHQLHQFAALMRWANATHGIPLVLSEAVTQPGLNYHRCQGGPATGCPCDVRKNARAEILRRAGSTSSSPTPPQPLPIAGGTNMMITRPQGGYYMLSPAGGVFAKGAPFKGSLPGEGHTPSAPIVGGAATLSGEGYWLVDRSGMVYAFGDARYLGPSPRFTRQWGIGTAEVPVVGIAAVGDKTYALAAARAGADPMDYVMEPDGRYGVT